MWGQYVGPVAVACRSDRLGWKRLAPRFHRQMAVMHSAECVEIGGLVAALLWCAVNSLSSKKRRVESLASSLWQPWHALSLSLSLRGLEMYFILFCICVSGEGEPKHFCKRRSAIILRYDKRVCLASDSPKPTWVARTPQHSWCRRPIPLPENKLKCSVARCSWAPPAGLWWKDTETWHAKQSDRLQKEIVRLICPFSLFL